MCLLHAYANPEHERRVGDALAGTVAVSLSHEVSPEAREYERAAATALNAAPSAARRASTSPGWARRSGGGCRRRACSSCSRRAACCRRRSPRACPLATVMSGPAAGVAAVSRLARRRARGQAVAFDMGGTSTDVALIVDGEAAMARSRTLGGHVIRDRRASPSRASRSAAARSSRSTTSARSRSDRTRRARVPARPATGAAATAPTITDAALLCGLIGAGGGVPGLALRRDLAEVALGGVGAERRARATELAWRALDVAQSLMSRALSNTVTRRGYDLRRCTLVAYGGGGPVHAGPLAARIGVARVLVPELAAGLLGARLLPRRGRRRRDPHPPRRAARRAPRRDRATAAASIAAVETARLGLGRTARVVQRRLELRYRGQNAGPARPLAGRRGRGRPAPRFTPLHRREYGFGGRRPDRGLRRRRAASVLAGDGGWPAAGRGRARRPAAASTTIVLAGGERREVPVIERRARSRGSGRLDGPAIIASALLLDHRVAGPVGDARRRRRDRARGAMSELDWTVLEAVRQATLAIAEEMRFDLMRSARSPVLREAGDLSCAITDARGHHRRAGQRHPDAPRRDGLHRPLPARTGRSGGAGRGDVYFVNHPEVGGNHLPDVKAVRPVFAGGRLWAFAVALAHWPDIGGALPGSYVPHARDLQQEGLVIPPVRLFDAAGERREALDLILANVRGADERLGDIRAQAAATATAAARLDALAGRLGARHRHARLDAMRRETAERVRRAVAALRDGVYTGADALDDDGAERRPVPIRCTLTIAGDHATFDFSASADQTRGPVNTTRFITAAAVHYLVKAVLAPDAGPNGGVHDAVTVRTRPRERLRRAYGRADRVRQPRDLAADPRRRRWRRSHRLVGDRVVAAGMGSSGLALFAGRRADGRAFVLYETHAGGSGARRRGRGRRDARAHVERDEHAGGGHRGRVPAGRRARGDQARSGGGGEHARRRRPLPALPRDGRRRRPDDGRRARRIAPPGSRRRRRGRAQRGLARARRAPRRIAGKTFLELRGGDVIELRTAGGGGWAPA